MYDMIDVPAGRTAPMPGSPRLLNVCAGDEPISPFEFATRAAVDLWNRALACVIFSHGADWTMEDFAPARHSDGIGLLVRLIDDEVCWQTGNLPERVQVVADESEEPTVGSVVSAIALSTVIAWRWSAPTPCPADRWMCDLVDVYDTMVAELHAGGPQRRRRGHGVPPLDPAVRAESVKATLRLGETARLHYPGTADSPGVDLRIGCALLVPRRVTGAARLVSGVSVELAGVAGVRGDRL